MEAFFAAIAALFGLCVGSFLNVLIIRTPMDKSVILPPSSCMSCGQKLRFYHNIPVLSFIFLRGKCGFCGAKISAMYPLVELASGIFALFASLKFGFTPTAAFIALSVLLLFALSVIDLKTKEVPDSINFAALIFGLIGSVALKGDFFYIVGSSFAMAGLFTLLRFALQTVLKKEALGEGDIIVVATMGALLGWQSCLVAIFLSAVFALIILLCLPRDYKIPYIPFLLLGTLPCLFFDSLVGAFLNNYFLQI